MKRRKRGLCLALALWLVLSLAGCGGAEKTQADDAPVEALGRYVEETVPLPPCRYAYDMVMLADGRLRVALAREDGQGVVYTTGPDRKGWLEIFEFPDEIGDQRIQEIALSPDGTVFCCALGIENGEESYSAHFWVIDPDGSCRGLPVDLADVAAEDTVYLDQCDFTDSGRLFAQFRTGEVREIDLKTGELGENLNELEPTIRRLGCAGESVYMVGQDTVSAHMEGQTAALENAMGQELVAALKDGGGDVPEFAFWQNSDGYVFYTTRQGLFSFIPGGSVVEELVSGNRSVLSEKDFLPTAMTGGEDGSFYVLGKRMDNGENVLLHYVYDDGAPTAPDAQLKVYSLYEDIEFPGLVARFRLAHPEMSVELEIGIRKDDKLTTEGDAIRTLNTEILAGDGPDLICLDGFNLESYLEKGLLMDLSGILAEAEPTLTQVTECYARDGKICAVPIAFDLPLVYGPEHIISQIHDMDSLVSAVTQLKAERPDDLGIMRALHPIRFTDYLYDGCSPALMERDGTLNGEKLTEYYRGMKTLYDLDAELQAQYPSLVTEARRFGVGELIGMAGTTEMLDHTRSIDFGPMRGMKQWAFALEARDELPDYVTGKLDVGASGIYKPELILGIPVTSQHLQVAADCVSFLLSEEPQGKNVRNRLPVNKAAFEKVASEELTFQMAPVISHLDGSWDDRYFPPQNPSEEDRENLRRWVAELSTPVLTDRTVRKLIMAQMTPCLSGEITPEEAASKAMRTLSLYLAE